MSDKIININKDDITITRITNLSEYVMKDCYYVIAQTLPMLAENFYYRVMHDVNRHNHILFVAETPRMVVGVLKGFVYDIHAQLEYFAVDKKYRRRGVGASLLKAYEEHVRNNCGATYVSLETSAGASNFYKNRGYVGNTRYLRKDFSR